MSGHTSRTNPFHFPLSRAPYCNALLKEKRGNEQTQFFVCGGRRKEGRKGAILFAFSFLVWGVFVSWDDDDDVTREGLCSRFLGFFVFFGLKN